MADIDRDELRAVMLAELQGAWTALRQAHPGERFYSFGVYTAPCAEYLMVTASTEEGLAAATERYHAQDGRDRTLRRVSLRWSPCDSPLHEEGQELLTRSDAIRQSGPDPYDDTEEGEAAVALAFEVMVEALQALDRANSFGAGEERQRIVLGVWMGDQSDEERVEYVRLLNPAAVADSFEREIEAGNRAFDALSVGK